MPPEADHGRTAMRGATFQASELKAERALVENSEFLYKKIQRSIFTDWMRSIAIYLVVATHILVTISWTVDMSKHDAPFNYKSLRSDPFIWAANCKPGHWIDCKRDLNNDGHYIFNPLKAKIFSIFRVFLQFGMPAFMYFSGRSMAFNKDGLGKFVSKKISRLIIPLIFGYLVFVVPTTYISCEWRPGMDDPPDSHCHDGFFNFYGWMVSNFKDGFSWLWFLPALFILSTLNYPFATWYKHRYWENYEGLHLQYDRAYLPFMFMTIVGFIVGLHFALGVSFWYGLLATLPYILNVAFMYGIHLLRKVGRFEMMFLGNCVPSLVLTLIHNDDIGEGSSKRMIAALCFYNFFYMQGVVDQVLDAEYANFKQTQGHKKWRPISLLLLMLILTITSPGTEYNVGYLWTYPIYTTPIETLAYVGGSWIWLVIFVRWGQTFYQDYFQESKFLYTHLTATSLVVYLVHWLFVDVLAALIVRPAKLGFLGALFVLVPGTILLSWLFYIFVRYVPFVGLAFGFVQPAKQKKAGAKENPKETGEVSDTEKIIPFSDNAPLASTLGSQQP